jgi:pSer/pThr/pTyr-binding forkhead associated (FHA) protein
VRRDGEWILRDLGSTNGTGLNGKRVGRASVHAGDQLLLGHQLIMLD